MKKRMIAGLILVCLLVTGLIHVAFADDTIDVVCDELVIKGATTMRALANVRPEQIMLIQLDERFLVESRDYRLSYRNGETTINMLAPLMADIDVGHHLLHLTIYTGDGLTAEIDLFFDVITPPDVINPQDLWLTEGSTAVFDMNVSVPPISYQWYQSKDGDVWTAVDGSNSRELRLPAVTLDMDGMQYRCDVQITRNYKRQTKPATLHVSPHVVPPATGDESQPMLWAVLCLLSASSLARIVRRGKQTSK